MSGNIPYLPTALTLSICVVLKIGVEDMGKMLRFPFELWIYAPYDFSPQERKFLVTAWWVCVTQAVTSDWGLGLHPGSLPTCFFTQLFLLLGRGQAVGMLVLCGYRHDKRNRLKPFGSTTGAHSGAQLTEACLLSLCLSPEWSGPLATITAPFAMSPI